MLDIDSIYDSTIQEYRGYGIFDVAKKIFQKSANSSLAKKVINSTTTKNLQKAANSSLGKEIQKSLLTGVTNATENAAESAYKKLGLSPSNKKRKKKKNTTPSKAKKSKGEGIVYE